MVDTPENEPEPEAVDVNAWFTYRHSVTGLIGRYPARLGEADPHLKRVADNAKPYALPPIPREAVEAALETRKTRKS